MNQTDSKEKTLQYSQERETEPMLNLQWELPGVLGFFFAIFCFCKLRNSSQSNFRPAELAFENIEITLER